MKHKPNLMIFHAGTGTYFGLNDGDVYVIDPDKMTDDMNHELDETGEMPAEAIDSEACVSWEEFINANTTDLTWGNCIAYSPSAIREEITESLLARYESDKDQAVLTWAATATDDDLNEIASYILQSDLIWTTYIDDLMDGLREGYRWSQEKCDHEYDSYCGKCGLASKEAK